MIDDIINETESRMDKSIKSLEKDYVGIRTGRANPAILDSVTVDAYGTPMPINQVATVSCPEPRLIMVQAWDKNNLSSIEKAILKADLSLNPSNDGNVIRIQIPELTEERRKELVKFAKQKAEDCKVAIRNIRRDSNDMIKELEKSKDISEDDSKREQENIQKITDKHIETVTKLATNKEKEILSI
jgi:ribosome recycling factor